jgi:hypothetical protein
MARKGEIRMSQQLVAARVPPLVDEDQTLVGEDQTLVDEDQTLVGEY